MSYIINGKTQVGWRIDKLADSDDEPQAFGMDFLKSYVAFVRERHVADQIVALLNESEALSDPIASGTPEAGKAVEDQIPASRPSGNVPDKGAP